MTTGGSSAPPAGMTPTMKALLAAIVVMGIAIVVALAFVAYGIVGGGGDKARGFGEQAVTLPPGCKIAGSKLSEGRILLHLDGPDDTDCRQVILVDAESGAILGRLTGR